MPQNPDNLQVYKLAYDFAKECHKIQFPREETYGLQSQLRRASLSIVLNISEGSGRSTNKDFISFLHNSLGSNNECGTLLKFAYDLKYINTQQFSELSESNNHIGKMLSNLIRSKQNGSKN